MSWAHPIDQRGRVIPAAGRSAAALASLSVQRAPRPMPQTIILMVTLAAALFLGVAIAEGTTATFTAVNAARLEAR
ncbi:hypothetical protein [Frigidibacter sp. MR17.24]|uniref:hypothetical protein n=1 Tax=Frigidibacter sp. MR17.24 TaxID=3127345 RepID=UPI003012DDDB